jgi:hypothetical protein
MSSPPAPDSSPVAPAGHLPTAPTPLGRHTLCPPRGQSAGQSHLEFLASAQSGNGPIWQDAVQFPPPEECSDVPIWPWCTCRRALRLGSPVRQIPNAIPLGQSDYYIDLIGP